MISWHGWASIWPTPLIDDVDELLERSSALAVERIVAAAQGRSNEVIALQRLNGHTHLTFDGVHNREAQDIVGVFRSIAEAAPGSYGVLYVRDDEARDHEDRAGFQVFVMKRGRVTREKDPWFSPFQPTVEAR